MSSVSRAAAADIHESKRRKSVVCLSFFFSRLGNLCHMQTGAVSFTASAHLST